MSVFVDKKFSAFEFYMRKHFKAECPKFEEFKKVFEIDHNAFFAFYLKILLEKLENIKRRSKPKVSEAVARKLRPGTRSSIPYPKKGLAAMKSGTIPDLNLHEMVKETLDGAITSFYAAVQKDKDLIKTLEEANTDTIKLEELYQITTNPSSDIVLPSTVQQEFDIKYYLKEPDAKFIYPEVRLHIQWMHENVVAPLLVKGSLQFTDVLIQYGILPIMYTDTYISEDLIFNFNNGYGVGLRFYDFQKYEEAIAYIQVMCEYDTELYYYQYADQQLVLIIKKPTT